MSSELIPVSVSLSDQEYLYPSPLDEMFMHRRLPPALNSSTRREVFTSSCFSDNVHVQFIQVSLQRKTIFYTPSDAKSGKLNCAVAYSHILYTMKEISET